jgi:hypothetical protein
MAMYGLNKDTPIQEIVDAEKQNLERRLAFIQKTCEDYGIKTYNDLGNIILMVDYLKQIETNTNVLN